MASAFRQNQINATLQMRVLIQSFKIGGVCKTRNLFVKVHEKLLDLSSKR